MESKRDHMVKVKNDLFIHLSNCVEKWNNFDYKHLVDALSLIDNKYVPLQVDGDIYSFLIDSLINTDDVEINIEEYNKKIITICKDHNSFDNEGLLIIKVDDDAFLTDAELKAKEDVY